MNTPFLEACPCKSTYKNKPESSGSIGIRPIPIAEQSFLLLLSSWLCFVSGFSIWPSPSPENKNENSSMSQKGLNIHNRKGKENHLEEFYPEFLPTVSIVFPNPVPLCPFRPKSSASPEEKTQNRDYFINVTLPSLNITCCSSRFVVSRITFVTEPLGPTMFTLPSPTSKLMLVNSFSEPISSGTS